MPDAKGIFVLPPITLQSSGNLLADRRFGLAEQLSAEGDHAAAADLLEQTLELAPDWAPAWLALGIARERINRQDDASAAFQRACELDADGRLGASLHLARATHNQPAAMPEAFVRDLFDQYADRFDAHLTGTLNYTGPAVLAAALRRAGAGLFRAVLDLGCGTGLMARTLAGHMDAMDGIDLAPRMASAAMATGLYRQVHVGDLAAVMGALRAGSYDAALAADVLVYLGDLAPCLAQVVRILEPGGLFAFTVQRGAHDDYQLGADMRFHHGEAYIGRALDAAGLSMVSMDRASTRQDRGIPVPGLVVVARRP